MINFIKRIFYKIRHIPRKTKSRFALQRGRKRIHSYKNLYCGKRCFIIGNGPSLNADDLEKLKNEITFGSHGIYYIFKNTDWRPTFYCAQDAKLINERYSEIKSECNGIQRFFALAKCCTYPDFSKKDVCVELDISPFEGGFPRFSDDLSKCAYEGFTVTYFNIQLAVYMGFREIYLLGVDHFYGGGSQDHFCEKDKCTNKPQTDKSTCAYEKAKDYGDQHNIRIYNATRGGHLEVFQRVDFDDLF